MAERLSEHICREKGYHKNENELRPLTQESNLDVRNLHVHAIQNDYIKRR